MRCYRAFELHSYRNVLGDLQGLTLQLFVMEHGHYDILYGCVSFRNDPKTLHLPLSSKLASVSNDRNKSHVILAKCHGMGGIYYNVVSLLFPSILV